VLLAADVIIRENLKTQTQKEGETATLQCKVDNPKNYPLKWLKNGEKISLSSGK